MSQRRWTRDLLALAIAGLLLRTSWQLFVHPIVGVADNRDFWRLLELTGLVYRTDQEQTVFKWVQLTFAYSAPGEVQYLTTELWFTRASTWLSRAWFGPAIYDLRALGAVHLLAYAVAATLLFASLRRLRSIGFGLVTLLGVFVLSDGARVAYFNSLYSDSASLIFFVGAVGMALWVARGRTPFAAWLAYLAMVASFSLAKPQNLAFVPGFALLTLFSCRHRVIGALGAGALAAMTIWALASDAYAATQGVNGAVHIREELLPHSPRPDRDRTELQLDRRRPEEVGLGEIARFYLRHPARWWKLAARASHECFTRLSFGNFERESGMPAFTLDHRFDGWSRLLERSLPRNVFVLLTIGVLLSLFWAYRALHTEGDERARALVGILLLAGCAAEFIVTVTFEANGTAKHLFIFNVGVDLVLLLVAAEVCAWGERAYAARP